MADSTLELRLKFIAENAQALESAAAELRQLGEEADGAAKKTAPLGNETENLGRKQQTLTGLIGGSRREVGFMVQSLEQATGSTGMLGKGITALMTGLGPIGIALTVVSLATEAFVSASKNAGDHALALAKDMAATGKSASDYGANWKSAAEMVKEADDKTKGLVESIGRLNTAQTVFERMGKQSEGIGALINPSTLLAKKIAEMGVFSQESAKQMDQLTQSIKDATAAADRAKWEEKLKLPSVDLAPFHDTETELDHVTDAANKAQEAIDKVLMAGGQAQAAVKISLGKAEEGDLNKVQLEYFANQDKLEKQATATQQAEFQKQQSQAQAHFQQMESLASGMIQRSQITGQDVRRQQLQGQIASGQGDLKAAQAELDTLGPYVDKYDENIRRLQSIKITGSLTQGDIPQMLAKMPKDLQASLKEAFDTGGAEGLKLKASELIASGDDFSNPEMWDVKKMAADLKAQVKKEQDKVKLADMIVQESGLDKNDATVKTAVGKATGTGAGAPGAAGGADTKGMMDAMGKELATFKPSTYLMLAIDKDIAGMAAVGKKIADTLISAMSDQIGDLGGQLGGSLVNAITNVGDGRYLKIPRAATGYVQ